ncbi:MAG: hypothetical protein IJP70_04825 [Bacteroidales bacterium]|nr:hypothetical protein [Bacteroidales bacterium]
MTIRVLYNYWLVRFGIRKLLPKEIIHRIQVRECGEMMVPLSSALILTNKDVILTGRESVVRKLEAVAGFLSAHGLRLYVWELYRTPEEQQRRKDERCRTIIGQHPDYSDEEVATLLGKQIANVGGGHQTGGAVDLTLCDAQGNLLDMGCAYQEHNRLTATDSPLLTREQRHRRKLLKQAMSQQGFVNYPAEWWHYSFGDKMWAAYSHQRVAIYGEVNQLK